MANAWPGWNCRAQPVPHKRSLLHTFRFPAQETKLHSGDTVYNVATGMYAGTIEKLDELACEVQIKLGSGKGPLPERMSVGPKGPLNTDVLREAVYRFARDVLDGNNSYPVIRDILAKAPPRILGRVAGESLAQSNDFLEAATEAVAGLDQSYLFIQGPPGSGKTYTSAHVIVELIRRGKKIGVASNSHKAIHNLLTKVEEFAVRHAVKFAGIKKSRGGDTDFDGTQLRNESDNRQIDLDAELIAGTAWLFADERFDRHLDYLFIDEAGQVSVANVVAMGTSRKHRACRRPDAAGSTDPGHASRPVGWLDSGFSVGRPGHGCPGSGHFPESNPPAAPEICRFISDAFYEGRLEPEPGTVDRHLIFAPGIRDLTPHGIHFHSVSEAGRSQKNPAEGKVIREYYEMLLKQQLASGGEAEKSDARRHFGGEPLQRAGELSALDPAGRRPGRHGG